MEESVKSSSNYEIFHKTLDKEVEKFLIEKKDAIKHKRFDKLANTKFFIGNNKVLYKKVLDSLFSLGLRWLNGATDYYAYNCEWIAIKENGKFGFLESGDTEGWCKEWVEYRVGSLQELSINKKFWPGVTLITDGEVQAEIQFAPAIIEEVIAYPIGRHDDPLPEKLTVHGMFEKMIAEGDAVVEEIAPDVNPKKQFGDKNIPLNLWSSLASSYGALGLYNGKLKYGGGNYKATPVEASIYIAGAMRHLAAWAEGEEFDPVDNVPNLGGVLANIAIILDSRAAGTLIDDRNIPGGYIKERAALQGIVASLQVLHAGKTPRHYTIADAKCNDAIL